MTALEPEVLVVGGGPAGSTVAGLLARSGRKVLLVDRATFPRPKPCGECLNPGAVAALERLGLREVVDALAPARLRGWSISGARSRASADFGSGLHGLGLPREALDHALVEEARRRGVGVEEGVRVEEVEAAETSGSRRPAVRLRGPDGASRTLRPRVVVGADGLRSRVARALGLVGPRPVPDRASLTFRIRFSHGTGPPRGRLRVQEGLTLGVAPVSADGRTGNATVVAATPRHAATLARAGEELAADLLRRWSEGPPPRIVDGPWASGPFRHPVPRPWAPGVVLVGDAAGYYDPFTGQGIYRALRSAELAARAVEEVLADRPALDGFDTSDPAGPWAPLARYGRTWCAETTPSRRLQAVVDAVMRRGWLREPTLAAVDGIGLLQAVVRVTGDAAPVSSLLNPLQWARARD